MSHVQDIFHRSHHVQRNEVTAARKGGYTIAVQNIHGVMPPPPEEHHNAVDNLNTIFQGMQNQIYELEGLAQANAVLTSSKYAVMAQLAHMTMAMNAMQAQLKTLASAQTNHTSSKIKHYCCSCGSKCNHWNKP